MNGNPIADISPLSALVRLNHLFIAATGTAAIEDLEGLIHLATLDIGYNAISDLAPLVANPGIGSGTRSGSGGIRYPSLRAASRFRRSEPGERSCTIGRWDLTELGGRNLLDRRCDNRYVM